MFWTNIPNLLLS